MHLLTKLVIPLAVMVGITALPISATYTTGDTVNSSVRNNDLASLGHDTNPADPVKPAKASVTILSESDLANASKAIDDIINAKLTEKNIKPTAETKDSEFLRRVYLDLAGRIPSVEEAAAFIKTRKSDKREALIKELLASDAYNSNMFNYWADLLRARNKLQDNFSGLPYIDWIKSSIKENKPYNKFIFELIAAEGPALARGNGATGYYILDSGMQEDNMANTVRVILGTRLSCAQCHDHPFDKWTRRDFFEMVGFTEGTDTRTTSGDITKTAKKLDANMPYSTDQVARDIGETLGLTVSNKNPGSVSLPKDYQYKDGRAGEKIKPLTMFEDDILKDAKTNPRETYAKWMTSPDNPRFTLVIANRMWKNFKRVGMIEPMDDFNDDSKPSNPVLAEYLVNLMVSVKYDIRKFQEILCNTQAYQRQTIIEPVDKFAFYHQGMPVQRLSAEQVWDSLMTLTVENVDSHKGNNATEMYKFYDDNKSKSMEDLARLALKVGAVRDKVREMEDEKRKLRDEMTKGGNKDQIQGKMNQLDTQMNGLKDQTGVVPSKYGNENPNEWRRASELASPMPPGHFLRVFGQSDRFLIDNASTSMNLTQSLELMNGMVEQTILTDDSKSVLRKTIDSVKTPDAKVTILYVAILSRMPSSREMSYGLKVMSLAPRRRGPEYLGWALLNSASFMFNE